MELRLGVYDVAEFVRQAAKVAQVGRKVGMIRAKLTLARLDGLFQAVALRSEGGQVGHASVLPGQASAPPGAGPA